MRRMGISNVPLVLVFQLCAGHLRIQEAGDPQNVKHIESSASDVALGACPPWAVPKYVAMAAYLTRGVRGRQAGQTLEGSDIRSQMLNQKLSTICLQNSEIFGFKSLEKVLLDRNTQF